MKSSGGQYVTKYATNIPGVQMYTGPKVRTDFCGYIQEKSIERETTLSSSYMTMS